MNKNSTENSVQITSIPSFRRPGHYAILAVYGFAWMFAAIWLAMGILLASVSQPYAVLLLVVDSIFICYLAHITRKLATRQTTQFIVEGTDKTLHLFKVFEGSKKNQHHSINLDEIRAVEHYRYQDSGSLIFVLKSGHKLEIPVWCMPERAKVLFEYLNKNGIAVTTI